MSDIASRLQLFTPKQLNELKYPTPFMLLDVHQVKRNYQALKSALKNAQIFYAPKANSDPVILRMLADAGASFEVASLTELQMLHHLGIDTKEIMYSNPVKPANHIKGAFELGVYRFAFDATYELEKLAHFAPGASVLLRVIVNDKDSTFPLSKKFGAEPQDAVALMQYARSLGLVPYGLTFHVGSQSLNQRMWELAIIEAGAIMRRLAEQDIKLEMLDVGGGFPANYGEEMPSVQEIGTLITKAVEEHLPYKVHLSAEPGRAIVADAALFASTIIGRANRGSKHWLYLDIGAFNGMMETLETDNHFHYPIATSLDPELTKDEPTRPFTLTGPTCDTQDTMFYDLELPDRLAIGDRIYIYATGAYTMTYASSFNGFGPPKVYYVNKK